MGNQRGRHRVDLYLGVGLISLGALLLLDQIFHIRIGGFLWPFFIILPGLAFFLFMKRWGKEAGFLAIPGSIITATGLLLLYQNVTNHWESWAYAWALIIPTSLGAGLIIFGRWSDLPPVRRIGSIFVQTGLIIFVLFGVLFELIIKVGDSDLNKIVLPIVIIAIGIYVIASQMGLFKSKRPSEDLILEVPPPDDLSWSQDREDDKTDEAGEDTPEEV